MRFLSKKQVRERVGLSPTQFQTRTPDFPRPLRIGYRVFWSDLEVDAWQQARLAERPTDPPEREDKSTD